MSDSSIEVLGTKQQRRWYAANKIKKRKDVSLPKLDVWNYDACQHHDSPRPDCEHQMCGGEPFAHQRVSALYHLVAYKSINASSTGTGKTLALALTLALAHQLGEPVKCLVVVMTASVKQWEHEMGRWVPGFKTAAVTSDLSKAQRIKVYSSDWNILVVGFHVATRDAENLMSVPFTQFISDDVDPLRNVDTKTARALVKLSTKKSVERVIVANATNLQTKLGDLYGASLPINGDSVWGTSTTFHNQFIKKEPVYIRTGKKVIKSFKTIGYKSMNRFKTQFDPMHIRYSYEDLEGDLNIPDIQTQQVYLDMYPAQRAKYDKLQQGVLEIEKKDQPPQQKMVSALTAWLHGSQILAGLPALGEADGPQASSKLDWLQERITNEWSDRKIIVYVRNVGTVEALQTRLDRDGVGYATIWGKETDADTRKAEIKRFWDDSNCRVIILTAAGERSLNLQNANIVVMLDLQLNPARVTQIAGRARRIGSSHKRVYVFQLLIRDSQEERYMTSLAARQALFDHVHDEESPDLFAKLDPAELLKLISP